MNGTSLFLSAFENNGYHIYSSPVCHMNYAVAPKIENSRLTVVVFLNNIAKNFTSSMEFDQLEDIIRNSNHVPKDNTKITFLYVIWDTGKNHDFNGKNIIYIDSTTGIAYPKRLSPSSKEAITIIDNILCYDNAKKSLNISRFGPIVESHTPWMTCLLVVINIIAYILTKDIASNYGYSPKSILECNFLGIFTYMFVHANLSHLVGNMVSLYCIGTALEEYIGAAKLFCLYIISGVFGSLTDLTICLMKNSSMIAAANDYSGVSGTITVGASGAICGLLTALIIKLLATPKNQRIYQVGSLLRYIVIIIFSGMLLKNINNATHIGGMLSGTIYMILFIMADRLDYYKRQIANAQTITATQKFLYKNKMPGHN